MKKIILPLLALLSYTANAQVGINTTTPNNATVLDITSNEKGILIPRLTTSQRDTNLADNNPLTVPPAGIANSALSPGTLIFNTTENRFEFWDGTVWRQLFVATSSVAGNDGVVKINSSNGGAKPTLTLSANGNKYGTAKQIVYTTPLVFAPSPTTSWPETTVPFPGVTSNIYIGTDDATKRWRENPINGQVHIWRVIANVTPGANSSGSVKMTFKNPDSNFEITSIGYLPGGSSGDGNILTFYFYTIADQESLNANRGYQLSAQADVACTVVVESFTRVSLFKD